MVDGRLGRPDGWMAVGLLSDRSGWMIHQIWLNQHTRIHFRTIGCRPLRSLFSPLCTHTRCTPRLALNGSGHAPPNPSVWTAWTLLLLLCLRLNRTAVRARAAPAFVETGVTQSVRRGAVRQLLGWQLLESPRASEGREWPRYSSRQLHEGKRQRQQWSAHAQSTNTKTVQGVGQTRSNSTGANGRESKRLQQQQRGVWAFNRKKTYKSRSNICTHPGTG